MTNTGNIIIIYNSQVYKIPITSGAGHESKLELQILQKVKKTHFFSNYTNDIQFSGPIQKSPALEPIKSKDHFDILDRYFLMCTKIKCDLNALINLDRISKVLIFIKTETPHLYSIYLKFAKTIYVPNTASHGDFHKGNILARNNSLVFIDWSLFSENSSIIFDVINYKVFEYSNGSWYESWKLLLSTLSHKYSYSVVVAYVLWKVAQELYILKVRKKSNKTQKYINILTDSSRYILD